MNPLFSFHFPLQACELLCCAALCWGSVSQLDRLGWCYTLCRMSRVELLGSDAVLCSASTPGSWDPPKPGWRGFPLDRFLFQELEVEGTEVRQKGCSVDRALALHTFRRLLLLWTLTHPLDKLLSLSFLAFYLSCLFILFQTGMISQHMFSWHIVSSTLNDIKVSMVTAAPQACSVCLLPGIVDDAVPPLKIFSPFSLFFQDCCVSGRWSGDEGRLLFRIFFLFFFLALLYLFILCAKGAVTWQWLPWPCWLMLFPLAAPAIQPQKPHRSTCAG